MQTSMLCQQKFTTDAQTRLIVTSHTTIKNSLQLNEKAYLLGSWVCVVINNIVTSVVYSCVQVFGSWGYWKNIQIQTGGHSCSCPYSQCTAGACVCLVKFYREFKSTQSVTRRTVLIIVLASALLSPYVQCTQVHVHYIYYIIYNVHVY